MTRESLRRTAGITLVLAWSAACNADRPVPTDAPRIDDPRMDVVAPSPSGDTYLNIDNLNYATVDQLNLYTWPDNTIANAIVMKFDLSAIPPGSTISSATLNLYLFSSDATADATYTVTVHQVIHRNPVVASATGDTYDGTNPWTATGAPHPLAQGDIGAAVDTRAIDKAAGFKQWDVTSLVQGWVSSPGSNFGLLLNSDPSKLRDRWRFFRSNEYATVNQRPSLSIVYTPPPTTGDEPVFNPATGDSLIYEDVMDQYTSPEDMDIGPARTFHPVSPTPAHYALEQGRSGAGKALSLTYDGSGQNFVWWLVPDGPWYPDNTSPFVIQYWFRISKNGGPGGSPGAGTTANGMKWFEFWAGDVRSQVGVTSGDPATTGPLWHMHAANSDGLLGFQPVGPHWTDLNNHQWHRVTYLYQPNLSVNATNGITRMWIDGTKIVDVSLTAAGVVPPGATQAWCTAAEVQQLDIARQITEIHLGDFLNGGTGTDFPMTLDFDDFRFWILPGRIQ